MGSFFYFLSLDPYDPCVQRDHVFKVLRSNKQRTSLLFSLSLPPSSSLSFRSLSPSSFPPPHPRFPPILHDTILSFLLFLLLAHLSPARVPRSSLSPCPASSPFGLSISVARTTVNKPLIGLTPISEALFEVNERPAVASITRVLQCFFLPPSATAPFGPPYLAICHCRILKCGLMTIYHLRISRRSRYSGGGAVSELTHDTCR